MNQEKGGLIIYTWNDFSEDVKVKAENITIPLPVENPFKELSSKNKNKHICKYKSIHSFILNVSIFIYVYEVRRMFITIMILLQVAGPVTHVGVYDPATQKHKVCCHTMLVCGYECM